MNDTSAIRHEMVALSEVQPFRLQLIPSDSIFSSDRWTKHWHDEVEIAYDLIGNNIRYINGRKIVFKPGSLSVIDSQYIHSVSPDSSVFSQHWYGTFLITLKPDFVYAVFPEYRELFFAKEYFEASEEIRYFERENRPRGNG